MRMERKPRADPSLPYEKIFECKSEVRIIEKSIHTTAFGKKRQKPTNQPSVPGEHLNSCKERAEDTSCRRETEVTMANLLFTS